MNLIAQARVNAQAGTPVWRGWGFELIERVNTGGPGRYRLTLIERDFNLSMPVSVVPEATADVTATYSLLTSGGRDVLLVTTRAAGVSSIENFCVSVWDDVDSENASIVIVP
jgi:hypothetical protein